MFLVNFVICGVPRSGGGAPLGSCKINALVHNCSKQDFQNTQFWGRKNAVIGAPVSRLNLSYRNLKLGLKTLTVSERVGSGAWSNFAAVIRVDPSICV